jgi:hypothetical protein
MKEEGRRISCTRTALGGEVRFGGRERTEARLIKTGYRSLGRDYIYISSVCASLAWVTPREAVRWLAGCGTGRDENEQTAREGRPGAIGERAQTRGHPSAAGGGGAIRKPGRLRVTRSALRVLGCPWPEARRAGQARQARKNNLGTKCNIHLERGPALGPMRWCGPGEADMEQGMDRSIR